MARQRRVTHRTEAVGIGRSLGGRHGNFPRAAGGRVFVARRLWRDVIGADLLQFALGLIGSIWLAVVSWSAADGKRGVLDGVRSA